MYKERKKNYSIWTCTTSSKLVGTEDVDFQSFSLYAVVVARIDVEMKITIISSVSSQSIFRMRTNSSQFFTSRSENNLSMFGKMKCVCYRVACVYVCNEPIVRSCQPKYNSNGEVDIHRYIEGVACMDVCRALSNGSMISYLLTTLRYHSHTEIEQICKYTW